MPKITFAVELSHLTDKIESVFASDAELIEFLKDMAAGKIDYQEFQRKFSKTDDKIDIIILGDETDLTTH